MDYNELNKIINKDLLYYKKKNDFLFFVLFCLLFDSVMEFRVTLFSFLLIFTLNLAC